MQEMESALSVAEQPAQESPATLDTNNDAVNAAEPQDEQQPAQEQLAGEEGQKAFAKRLREQETKWREDADREKQAALDEFSQAAYGIPYADYLEAKRNAEYQEKYGVTAEALQPMVDELVSNHPAVREAEQYRLQQAQDWAVKQFQDQLPELGVKSFEEVLTLPDYDQMANMMASGVSPVAAYRALHFDELMEARTKQAQQDQLKKINANGAASPGSLAHAVEPEPYFTPAQVRALSDADQVKYHEAIRSSMKKWK